MEKINECKNYCKQLKMNYVANEFENILQISENQNHTPLQFVYEMLNSEIAFRKQKELENQLKLSGLPLKHDFQNYDFQHNNGLSPVQFKTLCELFWLDQNFNIVLMGPSGTGKTYIAAGLCHKALKSGYRAYFRSMEQIIRTLKLKDVTRREGAEYKRLLKANLIVIDDIMLFAFEKHLAVEFFNFVNTIYEKTSLIITTNKSPQQWAEIIDDTVLVTALLDRLLFNCQVIKLSGESYRMKNRKEIFESPK